MLGKITSFKTLRKYTICLQPAFLVLLIPILLHASYITMKLGPLLYLQNTEFMHWNRIFSCTMCQLLWCHFVLFSYHPLASLKVQLVTNLHILWSPLVAPPTLWIPKDWNPMFRFLFLNPKHFCDWFYVIYIIFFLEMWISRK